MLPPLALQYKSKESSAPNDSNEILFMDLSTTSLTLPIGFTRLPTALTFQS